MAMTTDMLELRLNRLERTNKGLLALLVLGLLLGAGVTPEPADVLQARSIQVVDAQGLVRAEISTRDGDAGVYLTDAQGKRRLALFHADDATGLYINDETETTRIGVAQFSHGGGGVALHGPESRGAAVLYYKDGGSLRFFDADGTVTEQITSKN